MSAVEGEAGSSKLTFAAKGAYLIWRAPVRPVPLDSQLKVTAAFLLSLQFSIFPFFHLFLFLDDFQLTFDMVRNVWRTWCAFVFMVGARPLDAFYC